MGIKDINWHDQNPLYQSEARGRGWLGHSVAAKTGEGIYECFFASKSIIQNTLQNSGHIYIGLSGGVDSVVLLDLTYQFFIQHKLDLSHLTVIYINHQLQPEVNNQWQIFCQKLAEKYNLNFITEKISSQPQAGESIENFARKHRYHLFFKHVKPDLDILLLAHHLDDQAETVLFRLLKGAGPKGLSGMKNLYHYQSRVILRPLLSCSKQDILHYANSNHLDYIQDPSNELMAYDRNFLRKKIIPDLSSRFGSVNKAISRAAELYQQQQKALDYFIDPILITLQVEHISGYYCLDYNLFKVYPDYIQVSILRKWFESHQFLSPSEKKITQILHQIATASQDKVPEVCWGKSNEYILRKYQNKIFINKKSSNNAKIDQANGLVSLLSRDNIQIKTRILGQKIYFLNKTHSVSLKKFLQSLGVPPWDRENIPLYFYQEKYLVRVEGYWECKHVR